MSARAKPAPAPRKKHSLLEDEQGDKSFSRHALVVVIPISVVIVLLDVAGHPLSESGYGYLTTLVMTLGGWAGFRAGARYLQKRQDSDESP